VRVAMVCPYSLSRPGGAQGQVLGLARSLKRLGHVATVIAPADPSYPAGSDVEIVGRATPVRANGSVAPLCLSPAASRRAVDAATGAGVDVVHLHEPLAPLLGYGFLVGRRRFPLVGTFHRSGESTLYRVAGPLLRPALHRLVVRAAVSEAARATAETAIGGTYEVLFNGVELDRFTEAPPFPTDRPTVLFLGRHEERKGLGVLLEAFDKVPDPAVLWVSGDGPETADLRRRHPPSERLRWLGVLDDDEVASRLAGADVLCAPSRHGESFGMVLLEAMAAGAAVVCSDIPGYRAAAAGHARLVPPGDPVALAEALTEALGEAATVGRGGSGARAARAHAASWSMDRLAARYVELYERAAGPA